MIITCPYCKKKYNIDEKKIPAEAKGVKCKACGNRFPLKFDQDPAAQPEAIIEEAKSPSPDVKKVGTRKIAVSLSKGGVGKTTTAVNLAVGLAMVGKKVLLIDTDTQGQASYMLGAESQGGLTELVTNELGADEAIVEPRERLSLLSGGKSLAGLKRLISRKDFGGELTIKEALAPLESRFDYMIFDSSPGWDVLTVNVLFCANEILVPVSLEVMTLQGLTEFLKNISAIRKHREGLDIKYVLPTFFDKRVKKSFTILKKLEDLYGQNVCAPISNNVRVSEAPAYGKTIYEFAPGSPGAKGYRDLVRKVADDDSLFR
ncbi:MAG: zinc-ribbon domain-containing protein [Desulfobulbaceae bacterium]|uniref:Zinc-ribbon domain-containing protein n=1 Tax=Candidatus Desulfatifera sulfidica TaxID=2841691 RepID=A0A8J6N9R3_9BACT|nr:zinc-ribbon domain-containing protein [Candidatus Desulfatifera sulfidica]